MLRNKFWIHFHKSIDSTIFTQKLNFICLGHESDKEKWDQSFQEHKSELQEAPEPSLNEVGIASIGDMEVSEPSDNEVEVASSESSEEFSQNGIFLQRDIMYSEKVNKFINKHKAWRGNMMTERAQSKDLYRMDNICKKTWRALRQIVAKKTQWLIKSIPNNLREKPNSIHDKLKSFLSTFAMTKDPCIYYTLVACMIFLGRKRNYLKIIGRIAVDKKWKDYMKNETEYFKNCNNNKTSELKWEQIFTHPILSLAKALFYRETDMQDVFFKKSLGCEPKTNDDNTKTRMTIIDDYEYFRQKLLQTIEDKFQELC